MFFHEIFIGSLSPPATEKDSNTYLHAHAIVICLVLCHLSAPFFCLISLSNKFTFFIFDPIVRFRCASAKLRRIYYIALLLLPVVPFFFQKVETGIAIITFFGYYYPPFIFQYDVYAFLCYIVYTVTVCWCSFFLISLSTFKAHWTLYHSFVAFVYLVFIFGVTYSLMLTLPLMGGSFFCVLTSPILYCTSFYLYLVFKNILSKSE